MFKKSNRGMTLIETITTLAILSFISVACLGILASVFLAREKSDAAGKEQVALRQALLAITRDIRLAPPEGQDDLEQRYEMTGGVLKRNDGSVIAKNIDDENTFIKMNDDEDGKVSIKITSASGQTANTQIHLRIGM